MPCFGDVFRDHQGGFASAHIAPKPVELSLIIDGFNHHLHLITLRRFLYYFCIEGKIEGVEGGEAFVGFEKGMLPERVVLGNLRQPAMQADPLTALAIHDLAIFDGVVNIGARGDSGVDALTISYLSSNTLGDGDV